jgi:hypothetical protein
MQTTTSRKFAKLGKSSLGVAACAIATVTAFAMTSFNIGTGLGFVGKGDLQTPWGWNDATLQNNANTVSFFYDSSVVGAYSAVCEWTTGEGTRGERTHQVSHTKNVASVVKSSVAYDTRKNVHGKVTGFNLLGFSGAPIITESGDDIPVVGAPCPGNPGTDGVWTQVTLLSSTGTGGLYASSPQSGNVATLIWDSVTGSVQP